MKSIEKAIKEFQCCGCVSGSSPKTCDQFKLTSSESGEGHCENHCPGTMMFPGGRMLLGMPVGFNKLRGVEQKQFVYIFEKETPIQGYCPLNMPLWAMEHEGNLLVKVASPRILAFRIEVYLGKTMKDLGEWESKVVNVSEIQDQID